MSRNLGIVQMKVLEAVRDGMTSVSAIRSKIYPDDHKSEVAQKTVSRAIRTLERRGLLARGSISEKTGYRDVEKGRFFDTFRGCD